LETIDETESTFRQQYKPLYAPTGGTSRQEHVSRREEKILLSGDVLRGLGPPGKAMAEKVVASDPGPRGEGRMPQGQEQEGRRKCLPRELRIKLFDDVDRLRRGGLTYREIIDEIQRRYGIRISKSLVSEWLRGLHSPYNGRYVPSVEFLGPSEELAYVIGVRLGDGYTSANRIRLKVKDLEFATEFGRCLSKVLEKRPVKPKYLNSMGRYDVTVDSKTLYELLKKPVNLDRLKKYIEHCERCMAAFLRGFADSEGSVDKRGYITISNTNYELLIYIKDLLKRLNIESTGPWPQRRQGKTFYNPKTMKRYTYNKDCYYIYVKTNSIINFYKNIGFTIERKKRRLENYVKKHQTRKH
jgi:intein-encoded DNA endonuclease-like protein